MDARVDVDTLLEQSRWLRALALRLARDDASADDLVQDTLVAAIERPPPRSDDVGGLRGWLAKVLRNRALQDRRSEQIRAHHEPRAAREEAVDDATARDEALDQVRLQRVLAAAILDLPEPYRKAITLRWVDGLSARDVAAAQNVTYEAARQRLARGAALLREKLDHEWGRREAWSLVAIALPKDASPAAHLILPGLLAMSTLIKVGVAALVLVAVCIWFVFGREALSTHENGPAIAANPTTLEPTTKPVERARDPSSSELRVAAASTPVDESGAADADRILSGVVLDSEDAPVVGARIEALHNVNSGYESLDLNTFTAEVSLGKTLSDAAGRFHIGVDPGRPIVLVIDADRYAHTRLPFRYAGENVVAHLERGGVVMGSVMRKDGDAPVVSAGLRLVELQVDGDTRVRDDHIVFTGTTDAGGRFRIDALTAGKYYLMVTPIDDASQSWKNVELAAGSVVNLDIRVVHTPPLVGVVTDARTKLPIADATVGEAWVMDRAVRTNTLGEYTLKSFPLEGVGDIGVRAKGYGFKTVRVRTARDTPLPERVDVALEPARRARGRILDARGQPVAGATVLGVAIVQGKEQQMDWVTTTSSTSGTFELADLRSDMNHVLCVRREVFGTVIYEFPRDELQHAIVELGDIALPDMASVRGRVHRTDGEGVADHLVTLVGWNSDRLRSKAPHQFDLDGYIGERQARTDDQGRFVFVDVAPGTYDLQVRTRDVREPVHRSVEVAAASRIEGQDLVLDDGLAIAGRLIGPDREPVPECSLSILPSGDGPPRPSAYVQSDAQGRFHASGLAPGAYQVFTSRSVARGKANEKKQYARRVFGPVNAGDENVVITLEIASVLRGRVLDAKGVPVANAYLIAKTTRPEHESERHLVDAGGHFEFEIPYDVEVELVAGPPPPGTTVEPVSPTNQRIAAASASVGADQEPDPAHSVRRSGLHASEAEIELRLPVVLGPH